MKADSPPTMNGTANPLQHLWDHVTYPTKSLNFLQNTTNGAPTPAVSLEVLVIGAGLGGLATAISLVLRGHHVEVLEQADKLGEVGAGIQIPSNSSRILLEWGLGPFLNQSVVEPDGITFRRWENGDPIGYTKLVPDFVSKYSAPYYVIHRADFHRALYERAIQLGVKVRTGCRIVDYDPNVPSVIRDDGSAHKADLIIAADGIKSIARRYVPPGTEEPPTLTGFAAYRATVDVDKMLKDPDTAWLLSRPALNIWIGEDRHVMTYTIAAGKSFNMVLSHKDWASPETWDAKTALQDMQREFEGWDPRLVKVIKMIDNTLKWPLMMGSIRENYVSESGKLVLVGDAVHAMLPYMSQGAAMAVEDAAALGEALSHAHSRKEIPTVLAVFEKVRAQRASQMQQASAINGKLWHFADGPEQEARDRSMQDEVQGKPIRESANQWSDPTTQAWAYGYDTVGEIRRAINMGSGRGR